MEREKRGNNYSSWALIREVKPDKDGKKTHLKQCHFIFRQALVPMSIFSFKLGICHRCTSTN